MKELRRSGFSYRLIRLTPTIPWRILFWPDGPALVPVEGFEPSRPSGQQSLSLSCLPIPTHRLNGYPLILPYFIHPVNLALLINLDTSPYDIALYYMSQSGLLLVILLLHLMGSGHIGRVY